MIARTLHWVSLTCSAFVIVSFVLFAHSEISSASSHQAGLIAPPKTLAQNTPTGALGISTQPVTNTTAPVQAKPHVKGQPRRFIDGVAAKLETPFTSLVDTGNQWVEHLIPLVLALLAYGGGLGYLSRWAAGRA
jgi:hypothetical protein